MTYRQTVRDTQARLLLGAAMGENVKAVFVLEDGSVHELWRAHPHARCPEYRTWGTDDARYPAGFVRGTVVTPRTQRRVDAVLTGWQLNEVNRAVSPAARRAIEVLSLRITAALECSHWEEEDECFFRLRLCLMMGVADPMFEREMVGAFDAIQAGQDLDAVLADPALWSGAR